MKLFIYKHSDLRWAGALILIIPIWIGLAPEWYGGLKNWSWMQWLYNLLNGRWLVNIPICIALGYFVFLWCYKICKDNDIRLFRFLLAVIGLFFLDWKSQVDYAEIVWRLDYKMFLSGVLLIALVVMLIKFIRIVVLRNKNRKAAELEEKEGGKTKGFSNDNVENDDIPKNLKRYVSLIVEKLSATNIKKQSFAVGVIGEWGVGKTEFLKLIKKQIEDKAEVVEFNPWMCRTPEQVTQDFFASLKHQLSPKHSKLSKSLKEYSKYINKITLTPLTGFSLDMMLPAGGQSLYVKKQSLSEQLSQLPHPVVVIIDDIDRLEREEVFEVLRLIRNTGDLCNTIYIVAYDKEYVTCILEEKNIKDATAYLEKIFPVEVFLPKVEDYLIWKAFKSDINAQDGSMGMFTKSLFDQFSSNERALILRILDNYRRAKRFARLYMLNVNYLDQQSRGEINRVDLFWLELLQMYDKKAYNKLANEPTDLLYRDDERFKIKIGILQNATKKSNNVYLGDKFWKEETPNILKIMFENDIKTIKQSICHTENYEKYFTLSVSPYKLSNKELNELFAHDANPDEVVSKWVNSSKYSDSIAYQLKQIDVNKLQENKLKVFLCGLLCYGMKTGFVFTVKNILRKDQYYGDTKRIMHATVLSWMEEKMLNEKLLLQLSKLLNNLYVTPEYDDRDLEMGNLPLVISNEEIETLLAKLMKSYLEKHPEFSALDVMKEKGPLANLFNNCCVRVDDMINNELYFFNKQVAFDAVIVHFAKKEVKPTQKEYDNAYDIMFNQEKPVSVNIYKESNNFCDMSDTINQKMNNHFGSSYKSNENNKLEEFRIKCFVTEQI